VTYPPSPRTDSTRIAAVAFGFDCCARRRSSWYKD
jgi:hypothetical protein